MTNHPVILALGTVLHLITFILITLHCLRRRRNATSTILWIFLAWGFPVFGPLLYLTFGIDRVADRGFRKFLTEEHLLHTRKGTQETAPKAYWHNLLPGAPAQNEFQREFNRALNALLPDHPALANNQIVPLVTGDEAYPKMLEAIRNAKQHIHLQSFIIGNDATGREFMKALAAKAAEGVEIRLLYDRFGSTCAHLCGLFRKYKRLPNFQIAGWTQANFLKKQFQINLRNHRKALIIDGEKAFFGGINLHSENTSSHRKGPIRDYHFDVTGPLVQELQYSFLRDWYFITEEDPETLLSGTHFPASEPAGLPSIAHRATEGELTARLINSGPSTEKDVAIEAFFSSITLARKQILAVTPYFVPPVDVLRALHSAALRGLDVRLIVPQKNNHFYTGLASRALYEDLLIAGVKIFERQPPFMHAKALVIDGEFSLIGTANLDERSLNLNYESSVAVYSETFADTMKCIIHEDIDLSDEVSLSGWQRRPAHRRLLENLAALMTPVL